MITLKGKHLTSYLIFFILLVNMKFLSICKLPFNSNTMNLISWGLVAIGYIFLLKGKLEIRKDYLFLEFFNFYVLISQLIICVYSMKTYGQDMMDMCLCAGGYAVLLLVYMCLLSFEIEGEAFLLKKIWIFQYIYILMIIVHAVFYNVLRIRVFKFAMLSSKTNNVRIFLGALFPFFIFYSFYNVLMNKNRKQMLVALSIGIFAEVYVQATRAIELGLFLGLALMWMVCSGRNWKTIKKVFFVLIVIVVMSYLGYIQDIINSFSIDPKLNDNYKSSLARMNSIKYFSQFTKNNIWLGMGWVRPKSYELRRIWSGPNNVYFFDDLGIMGQFFRQGLIGLMIYILMLIRMLYIIFVLPHENEIKCLLIGIFAYLVSTMISQNCFDGQRILSIPFYLAVFEYSYKKYKKYKRGEGQYENSNFNIS